MFQSTWTELLLVLGIGAYMCGRKDLPRVAHVCGVQVGRVVGFVQGAKHRASTSMETTQELKQLQHELRMGLRELDAVKAELAVSLTPSQMMSGGGGGGLSRPLPIKTPTNTRMPSPTAPLSSTASSSSTTLPPPPPQSTSQSLLQSTEYQAKAAIAEREWQSNHNTHLSFVSRGERSYQKSNGNLHGAAQLARLLQDSLVFDQYDRVTRQQESDLQNRVEKIMEKQPNKRTSVVNETTTKSAKETATKHTRK